MYVEDLCLKSFLGCCTHAGEKVNAASERLSPVFTLIGCAGILWAITRLTFHHNSGCERCVHLPTVQHFKEVQVLVMVAMKEKFHFEILQGHCLQVYNWIHVWGWWWWWCLKPYRNNRLILISFHKENLEICVALIHPPFVIISFYTHS